MTEKSFEFKEKKAFIIDLDGVVWQGDEVIEGCPETIEKLKNMGKEVVFVSNNSSMSKIEAQEKLSKMNIKTELNDIFNAPGVTADYISELQPNAKVYVIGMKGLKDEIVNSDLKLSEPVEADFLVAGYDNNLNYESLSNSLQALLAGAKFIATNDDGLLPVKNGFLPGAGATIGAIKGMIKRDPDVVIGKPNDIMIKMVLNYLKMKPEECVFIGDSLKTDIILANKSNITSILVLSGNTSKKRLVKSEIQPDFIFTSIHELLNYL